MKFSEFNIREDIVTSLSDAGIVDAFEIQEITLPLLLEGRDVIGQAKTGEGKTLAFGVPILNRIVHEDWKKWPSALIVLPTRELANQVVEDLETASKNRDGALDIWLIVGGNDMNLQREKLAAGADIVVGTPGRLLDLARQGELHLEGVEFLVLDEADQMLNMGFIDDVESLLQMASSENRQTLCFSATMPSEIALIAQRYLKNPMRVSTLMASEEGATVDNIEYFAFQVHPLDKIEVLARILQVPERQKAIIFTQMKHRAQELAEELRLRGFNVGQLHGNLSQVNRDKSLKTFSDSDDEKSILVTTDVAARGIDIDNVSLVLNYECPGDKEAFLHRTGRTGRAGNSGVAVTFVEWAELRKWNDICKDLELDLQDPVETYSPDEGYKTALGIPEGVDGFISDDARNSYKEHKAQASANRQKGTRAGGRNGERGGQRGAGEGRNKPFRKRNPSGEGQGSGGRAVEFDDRKKRREKGTRTRRRAE
ncbi:MAG: DEAD/DEAH box helicase [Candidatus Ancillula sp.]|jgi:superfamily II DNA/RNA helicase|nr:DEAD/DEAH box helicase [Candidatus Ancillula sp.]